MTAAELKVSISHSFQVAALMLHNLLSLFYILFFFKNILPLTLKIKVIIMSLQL